MRASAERIYSLGDSVPRVAPLSLPPSSSLAPGQAVSVMAVTRTISGVVRVRVRIDDHYPDG
jgi:hypothetical protein